MLLCSLIFLWLLYMKKTMLVICPLELVFVHFACYWYCIHFVSHPVSSTSKCGFLAVLYRLNFVMTGPRGRLPHPGEGGVSPPNVSEQICWSWFREWNVIFWWRDTECSHGKLEQREESIHEQRDFLFLHAPRRRVFLARITSTSDHGIATTTISFLRTDPPFMLFRGFFWCFPMQKADVQASNLPHRFFQFWQMDPTQKAGLVTLQVEFRSEAWQATS